jgi:hypothetical protein
MSMALFELFLSGAWFCCFLGRPGKNQFSHVNIKKGTICFVPLFSIIRKEGINENFGKNTT